MSSRQWTIPLQQEFRSTMAVDSPIINLSSLSSYHFARNRMNSTQNQSHNLKAVDLIPFEHALRDSSLFSCTESNINGSIEQLQCVVAPSFCASLMSSLKSTQSVLELIVDWSHGREKRASSSRASLVALQELTSQIVGGINVPAIQLPKWLTIFVRIFIIEDHGMLWWSLEALECRQGTSSLFTKWQKQKRCWKLRALPFLSPFHLQNSQ